MNPQTPAELRATFDRSERQLSIAKLLGGVDRGSEGRQYGLGELMQEYQRALTAPSRPEPTFEPLVEPDPPAVVLQKQRAGLLPHGIVRTDDPFRTG